MHRTLINAAQGLALFIILIGVIATYWPALNGIPMFDDQQNLQGLTTVANLDSALQFAFSGHAGPLGRPIALASFSLQAYAWPDHPEILIRTNILIHALNGALLAWCLLWLGRLRGLSPQQAEWGAIASAALWLVIPLLASSTLFIVQRMATLSATFMLLGLLGYLTARSRLYERPNLALLGMTASIGVGTLLAVLSKENGALLPVLVLAIETTLLRAQLFKTSTARRVWGWLCLILPLLVILAFMATKVPYSESAVQYREFTAEQRLWTQAGILWQYLLHAFAPMPTQLTPFHDQLRASPSLFQVGTLLAVSAWTIVIGTALRFRQRLPLLSFAVFWYLGAHLLESTVLNLELYFAHRNYLALIGPAYAIAAGALGIVGPRAKLARTLLAGYVVILAASLYSVTSLWGQPSLAAEMWSVYRPDSIRANLHLAAQLHQDQWHGAALKVLNETYTADPKRRTEVGIQALTLACAMHPEVNQAEFAETLNRQVKVARAHPDLPRILLELQRLLLKEPCTGVPLDMIERITLSALSNPAYSGAARSKQNLYAVLTELAIAQHDFGKTMSYIEESLHIQPSLETLHLALKVLIAAGRADLGQSFIDMVRTRMPRHPVQRLDWQRQLDQMEQQLVEINATQQALHQQEAQ